MLPLTTKLSVKVKIFKPNFGMIDNVFAKFIYFPLTVKLTELN